MALNHQLARMRRHSQRVALKKGCLQDISSVIFSQDSKLLAAQGGGPDWSLVLWQWEKSKVLASVRTSNPLGVPMTQVAHLMTWAHSSS